MPRYLALVVFLAACSGDVAYVLPGTTEADDDGGSAGSSGGGSLMPIDSDGSVASQDAANDADDAGDVIPDVDAGTTAQADSGTDSSVSQPDSGSDSSTPLGMQCDSCSDDSDCSPDYVCRYHAPTMGKACFHLCKGPAPTGTVCYDRGDPIRFYEPISKSCEQWKLQYGM